jgi:hypothetical protein
MGHWVDNDDRGSAHTGKIEGECESYDEGEGKEEIRSDYLKLGLKNDKGRDIKIGP